MILSLTERCCRRFQLLTGRTNVWLAVQLTNLSIVVYFVWAALYSSQTGPVTRVLVGIFCAGLLYALTLTVFRVPIEAYEDQSYRRVAKGLRNPRRVRDVGLRLSFLTLSIVLCYPVLFVYFTLRVRLVLLTYSLVVLTTVLLYVLACDPLPPVAGKVTNWLRGLTGPRSAPADVPEPHSPGGADSSGRLGHLSGFRRRPARTPTDSPLDPDPGWNVIRPNLPREAQSRRLSIGASDRWMPA